MNATKPSTRTAPPRVSARDTDSLVGAAIHDLTPVLVVNPADLIEIEQGGESMSASMSQLPAGSVPDPLTVNTLNIGTHARLVATATGVTLQCFDGANWIDQITYTAIPGT